MLTAQRYRGIRPGRKSEDPVPWRIRIRVSERTRKRQSTRLKRSHMEFFSIPGPSPTRSYNPQPTTARALFTKDLASFTTSDSRCIDKLKSYNRFDSSPNAGFCFCTHPYTRYESHRRRSQHEAFCIIQLVSLPFAVVCLNYSMAGILSIDAR